MNISEDDLIPDYQTLSPTDFRAQLNKVSQSFSKFFNDSQNAFNGATLNSQGKNVPMKPVTIGKLELSPLLSNKSKLMFLIRKGNDKYTYNMEEMLKVFHLLAKLFSHQATFYSGIEDTFTSMNKEIRNAKIMNDSLRKSMDSEYVPRDMLMKKHQAQLKAEEELKTYISKFQQAELSNSKCERKLTFILVALFFIAIGLVYLRVL